VAKFSFLFLMATDPHRRTQTKRYFSSTTQRESASSELKLEVPKVNYSLTLDALTLKPSGALGTYIIL
jgi:hypothetical protein